jgi:hypothetical protein
MGKLMINDLLLAFWPPKKTDKPIFVETAVAPAWQTTVKDSPEHPVVDA